MEVSGLRGLPYLTLGVLGTGGFADVFKVKHVHTGQLFALKKIKKYRMNDSKIKPQIERQIELMKQMNHPNIIKLEDSFATEDGQTLLVLELAQGGNLYDKLQQSGSFPEYRVVSYIKNLVSALEYLHNRQQPIIHRDIKPQNLLIDQSDQLKLSDFGSANVLDEGGSGTRVTYAGTMIYMAPQMVLNDPYTTSLDLWNVGLIIYELLTGENPFQKVDVMKLQSMIVNTQLSFPPYFPVLARDVVKRLLKKNPDQRMTLSQLKTHIWLNIGMQQTNLLTNQFDIRKSKKYEQAMSSIELLKKNLERKRQQQQQIRLIKQKIKQRKREYQLMALKQPEDNYLQLRSELCQLRLQMYQNQRKLKIKHQKILKQQQKRRSIQQQQRKQIEEYLIKISKLKQFPIKKHILLKNQLEQAIVCMKQLIVKMQLLPQTIKNDLEYIRQPRVRTNKPPINMELLKMTVKLMTTQYNALIEKKECLIMQQASQSNKNSEQSIHSI